MAGKWYRGPLLSPFSCLLPPVGSLPIDFLFLFPWAGATFIPETFVPAAPTTPNAPIVPGLHRVVSLLHFPIDGGISSFDSIERTLVRLETSSKTSDSWLIDVRLLNVLSSNYDCFVSAVLTETKQYNAIFHPEFPPNTGTAQSHMN